MSTFTTFFLKDLPYEHSALTPYIDEETMKLHHGKHHATYISKLNTAVSSEKVKGSLLDLIENAKNLSKSIKNNAGGHYNHSLFWEIMTPNKVKRNGISSELKEKINESFGSFDEMKRVFTTESIGVFGSGWVWLGVKEDDTLGILSSSNQDNPLMKGVCNYKMFPILCLDLWEHAYYLNYQNKRPDYIDSWWNVVNWEQVSYYWKEYASKKNPVPFE